MFLNGAQSPFRVNKTGLLTLYALRAISAQVGVNSYFAYESSSSAVIGSLSSVKAVSHKMRDAATRMIVGPGMLVAVAIVDIWVCLNIALVIPR
jgi:hypothetical protein